MRGGYGYVGQRRHGSQISWFVQGLHNTTNNPVAADAPPTFRIYGSTEVPVAVGSGVAFDTANLVGVYKCTVSLSSGFTPGDVYMAVTQWQVSGVTQSCISYFQVT